MQSKTNRCGIKSSNRTSRSMQHHRRTSLLMLLALSAALLYQACESNPFDNDEIKGTNRTVTGEISLFDGSSPEGIYVWLEGIDIGTTTDAAGAFQLQLPPSLNQSNLSPTNTILKLYFYMANYGLRHKQVVINNGEFVYNRADLNKSGQLTPPLALRRFLRVKSEVTPPTVRSNYTGIIGVTAIVDSPSDSATVLFPGAMGGLLGAVLLKKVDSQQVFIYEAVPGLQSVDKVLVSNAPQTRTMGFGISQRPLPVGKYEVIPYVLVGHEKLPPGLLNSLGHNVTKLTPNYLKIPFRRENAILEVVQ